MDMEMETGRKIEKIGGVSLDLTYYPGEDLYCDGEVEDRLLELVKENDASQFDRIIREKKDWPTLYHLSGVRENIVSWIPFDGTEKVLEIGAGPGAVTGALARACKSVTCVDLSKKRSLINAYRHKDCENINILVGNFEDIEPHLDTDYDYIFLIGVFEYAESYLHSALPFEDELSKILAHRKEGGRIVIAIENRLGLKYFAGCAEDHSGVYFDGIESYGNDAPPAKTFSVTALKGLFERCGQMQYSFYYPYPDYKFMSVLYSDRRLPQEGELTDNIRNFDRDRLLLFDERKAYEGILRDGLYPVFANSFEVILGPELPVTYCKYSNDRDEKYRIRTSFVEKQEVQEDSGRFNFMNFALQGKDQRITEVVKTPMTEAAKEHLLAMIPASEALTKRYMEPQEESGETLGIFEVKPILQIAGCRAAKDGKSVVFDRIHGKPLENLLERKLFEKDAQGFLSLLDEFVSRVGENEQVPAADYDMTFANILVEREVWTAIDYEWFVDRPVPVKDMLGRSLLVFFLENESRREQAENLIGLRNIFEHCGLTAEDIDRLSREETEFQQKVTGGNMSLGALRALMGTAVIKPAQLQSEEEIEKARSKETKESQSLSSVQVYFDRGQGFSEEDSYFVGSPYLEEGMITFAVEIPEDAKRLRIDPAICPCIVMVRSFTPEGANPSARLLRRNVRANGRTNRDGSIIFTTHDPNIVWNIEKIRKKAGAFTKLHVTLQMCGLPSTMAGAMEDGARSKSGAF